MPKPEKGASENGRQLALRRQVGEHLVDQRRGRILVDCPDDGDNQLVASEDAPRRRDEVGPLDARQRLERSLGLLAIRVAGKGVRPPGARRDRARIIGVMPEPRVGVLAHPQERLLVEAWRVDSEA